MQIIRQKSFANGKVYALQTSDGYPVECTDTFLPTYTRDAIGPHQNRLITDELGDRSQRWMIGVSVMSGCPCRCKFCATGNLPRWRNLAASEIVQQVEFILQKHPDRNPQDSDEFKINYTRMGEPFLNIENVRFAIREIERRYPGTHHYVSTIGIRSSDFGWIEGNTTLQLSLHAMTDKRRDWLIPYRNKMNIAELGETRTASARKTTLNLTLVEDADFNIDVLKKHFPAEHFFVKLSPINSNATSEQHALGSGSVEGVNLI